jgi:hypothetical protein
MIPGMGRLSNLGKTVLGKTAAKAGVGGTEEVIAGTAGAAYDKAAQILSNEEDAAKYNQFLAKDAKDFLSERAREFAAGAGQAGILGLPISYAQVKAEQRNTIVDPPKTGDPDFDAGADAASSIASIVLSGKDAGQPLQDVGKPFTQTFSKPKPPKPVQGELFPAQPDILTSPDVKQGSLFGEDIPAAEAEAKRVATAAVAPETAEIAEGVEAILGVPPQTSLEQAQIAAKDQEVRQVEREMQAQNRLDNKRSFLSDKAAKKAAKELADLPETEQAILRRLREKYPEAFSGKTTPEALEQQVLAAQEYEAIRKAIPKVAPQVIRDLRTQQIKNDEQFVKDRERAFLQEQENRYARENQVEPKQGTLEFPPEQQELQFTTPKSDSFTTPELENRWMRPVTPTPTQLTSDTKSQRPKLSQRINLTKGNTLTSVQSQGIPADTAAPALTKAEAIENSNVDFGTPKTSGVSLNMGPKAAAARLGSKQSTPQRTLASGTTITNRQLRNMRAAGVLPESSDTGITNTTIPPEVAKRRAELGLSNVIVDDADAPEPNAAIVKTVEEIKAEIAKKAKNLKEKTKLFEREINARNNTADRLAAIVTVMGEKLSETDKRVLEKIKSYPFLNRIKVKVVSAEEITKLRGNGESALGLFVQDYYGDPGTILLQESSGDGDSFNSQGVNVETILHELAHAITVHIMDNPPLIGLRAREVRRALAELDLIRKELLNYLKDDYTLNPAQKFLLEAATKNSKELVAYTYTSKMFQDMVKSRTPTLWERIKDSISVLLGFKPAEANIVDRILNLADTLADAQREQLSYEYARNDKGATQSQRNAPSVNAAESRSLPDDTTAEDITYSGFSDLLGIKGMETKNQDLNRDRQGGVLGFARQLFSSYGIKSKKFIDAMENMQGLVQRILAEEQAAKYRMDNLRAETKYAWKGDEHTPKGIERLLNSPNPKIKELGKEMQAIRERYKSLALQLRNEFLIGKQVLTKKDINIANAIEKNLETYMTRAYVTDINQKATGMPFERTISENFKRDMLAAWKAGRDAKPGDPALSNKFYVIARNAVEFFKNNVLTFKDGWESSLTMDELRFRHKLLAGHGFGNIDPETNQPYAQTREAIVAEIKNALKAVQPRIDETAEQLMMDVLGVNPDGTPREEGVAFKYYRGGSAIDRTILQLRRDVPPEIRALWGEIRDPFDAMFITMQKLANTLARTKMMNEERERGLREGWLFTTENRPPGDKFNYQINGEDYGGLNKMWTTQAYKTQLEAVTKMELINNAALEALPFLSKTVVEGIQAFAVLPRWNKWADVVLTPDNYAQNLLGSPVTLVMTGNYTDYKPIVEAWASAKKILWDAKRGKADKDVLEIYQAMILDSALVGELKAEFNKGVNRDIIEDFIRDIPESDVKGRLHAFLGGKVSNAITKGISLRETLTDFYAMMDLWAKIAVYKAETKRLKAFSDRNNKGWTTEKIARIAAFRTRNTCLSQQRAVGLVKGLEHTGLSTYLIYYTEMARITVTNILTALNDIKTGAKVGDKEWIAHGFARLAGVSAATTFNITGTAASWALKTSLISGLLGLATSYEDDDMDKILRALGDFGVGRTLVTIGKDDKGNPLFMDVGRSDPVEPVGSPFREVMDAVIKGEDVGKAVERAWDLVSGLFFVNGVWRGLINATVNYNVNRPGLTERNNFKLYQNSMDTLESLGFSPEMADRFIKSTEQMAPRALTSAARVAEPSTESYPPLAKFLLLTGHPIVKFDPQESAKDMALKQGRVMGEARDNLFATLKGGNAIDKEKVEKVYMESLTKERAHFDKLLDYVEGAKAAGFRPTQIRGYLEEANLNRDVVDNVMRGRFRSVLITDSVMSRTEDEFKRLTKGLRDEREAKLLVRELERELNNLSRKYAFWNGEEK